MKTKKKHKVITIILTIPVIMALLINTIIYLSPSIVLGHNEEYIIYDRNDEYAFTYHYNAIAKYVNLEDISPYFKAAIIASEDQRFYSHNGLDYRRIIASLLSNIKCLALLLCLYDWLYSDNINIIFIKILEKLMEVKSTISY